MLWKYELTALISPTAVSSEPRRESPIFIPTILAPGATPFLSVQSGWYAAAIAATCVPCDPIQEYKQTK